MFLNISIYKNIKYTYSPYDIPMYKSVKNTKKKEAINVTYARMWKLILHLNKNILFHVKMACFLCYFKPILFWQLRLKIEMLALANINKSNKFQKVKYNIFLRQTYYFHLLSNRII